MPMDRNDLLNAIIDDGVTEIGLAYPKPGQKGKRDGGIAGFEACRGLSDTELLTLLAKARKDTGEAFRHDVYHYFYHRNFELQVEWTLNVLSAAMAANGGTPLVAVTVRGMLKAADILGVQEG